jgi:hypothetical protein
MSGCARIAALVLVSALLSGCGGRGVSYEARPQPAHVSTTVKKGMTEAEVIAILGEPTRRGKFLVYPNDPIKTANKEQVIYWESPKLGNVQVQFKAGLVHGIMKK